MRVLVVYELIPEETKVFVVDNPDEATLEILQKAHNQYVNYSDEEEYASKLNELLPKFTELKLENNKPFEGPFDLVIHSGFGL